MGVQLTAWASWKKKNMRSERKDRKGMEVWGEREGKEMSKEGREREKEGEENGKGGRRKWKRRGKGMKRDRKEKGRLEGRYCRKKK